MFANLNFVFMVMTILIIVQTCSSMRMPLPSYIKPCNISDEKLDECMVRNGNEALPFVLKGDQKFNIPNLLPLRVPQITIQSRGDLRMDFKDCELHGLETTRLTKMHVDFEKNNTEIEVSIERLNLIADYDINGRILVLPIVGHGPSNITIADGIYNFKFSYKLVDRHGKRYLQFVTDNLEYTPTRVYFRLDNLFNGDRMLGNAMDSFLNQNWKEVNDELYPSLKDAIAVIVKSIAKGLFTKVSFDDLYLN